MAGFGASRSLLHCSLELMKEAVRNGAMLKNDSAWKALLALDEPADFMIGMMNLKAGK